MTKKKTLIDVQGLSKIYNFGTDNEVQALSGINLQIPHGSVLSIMGPSGCGKTTLLNCISGIDTPTEGQITIDGRDLAQMKDKKRTDFRAKNMGFIFQTFNLIPVLTALENVEVPLLINGIPPKRAREIAEEALRNVGLQDRLHHRPNELSGGQRQRVTVARSVVHKPKIIWADEPTGNLDTKTANEVLDIILALKEDRDTTVVIVTHDPNIADRTDHVVRMDSGRIIEA